MGFYWSRGISGDMNVLRISDCSQCKESSGIQINDLRIGQDFEKHIYGVREEGYAPPTTIVLLDVAHIVV